MTKFNKSLFAFIVVSLTMFAAGCGGGGGGGGTFLPAGETEEAPSAVSTLTTAQSVFSATSASQNLIMTIPVLSGQNTNFLMTVTNNSGSNQTVGIAPATSFAAALRPAADAPVLKASQVVGPDYELEQMAAAKGRLQEVLRRNTMLAVRQGAGMRGSLRGASHADEKVGDIVDIKLVSDGSGANYITRKFKLERKKDNLYKIFIDQEEYLGLSAKDGIYAVTSADLDHFAEELEKYILPFMTQNYGKVRDVDGDGCLSIMISPVYAKLNFAGLFNSEDMVPVSARNNNNRDLIGIWSPTAGWVDGLTTSYNIKRERWLAATRETFSHEMQHAINFSAKVFAGGVLNSSASMEDVWLDEGLCVCAEARYRQLRGNAGKQSYVGNSGGGSLVTDYAGNDNRFNYWITSPSGAAIQGWASEFAHYGQKGLLLYYIFEQYGADKIKTIVQSTSTGMTNLNNVLGAGSFASLVNNWQFAVVNEGLRTAGLVDINAISARFRYQEALKLNTIHKVIQYDAKFPDEVSVAAGATAFYVIKQPASLPGSDYRFIVTSNQDQAVAVNLIRLP